MLQPAPIEAWAYKHPGSEKWCLATVEPAVENLWLKPGEVVVYYELRPYNQHWDTASLVPVCFAWWKEGMSSAAIGHRPPSIAQMEYAVAQLFIDRNSPRILHCG